MGAQVSLISPTAATVATEAYVSELQNIQYGRNLGNSRFLKSLKCISPDGYVVVKIFIKPSRISLASIVKELTCKYGIYFL